MISERQVAKSFDDLWRDVTPLLRPNFVAMFNTAYREPLRDSSGNEANAVGNRDGNSPSVVAELGYVIASKQVREKQSNAEISTHLETLEVCKELARARISKFNELAFESIEISNSELEEALELAERYELLLGLTPDSVAFAPLISGAGIVDACEADIAADHCLWEVKAVRRNVAGKDIRQLLVYLALNSVSGQNKWTHAGIFNPRLSQYYQFGIDHFVELISGGKSAGDVFHEMIEYLSSRDIQIDSKF